MGVQWGCVLTAHTIRSCTAGRAGAPAGTAREAELLSTITSLKTALERATASSTPTTKYMAVSLGGGRIRKGGGGGHKASACHLDAGPPL